MGTGAPGAGSRESTMVTGEFEATPVAPAAGLTETTWGRGTVVVAGTAIVVGTTPPPSGPMARR